MKKYFLGIFLFIFFSCNIFSVFGSNEEIVVANESQSKEIKKDEFNDEKKKTSKNEIIGNLLGNEDSQHIKEAENKIKELENELEKNQTSTNSLHIVEKNIKKEIESIKDKLQNERIIGQLEKENEVLKKELSIKENMLNELQGEGIKNELKKQELEVLLNNYKNLKNKYEDKVTKRNNEKIQNIVFYFFILLVTLFVLKYFISYVGKIFKTDKEEIETILGMIFSILITIYCLYVMVNILQIFEEITYFLLLVLGSIIVTFKSFIISVFSFFFSIAFKMKIGMYVKIDNKPCKITKIGVFFTEVEIYGNDLSVQGKKQYHNSEFVTNSSTLDIKELGVINTVKYKFSSKDHDELIITMIEKLLNDETDDINNLGKKTLLSYGYTIGREGSDNELVITLKSKKGNNSKIFKIMKDIDKIVNYYEKGKL